MMDFFEKEWPTYEVQPDTMAYNLLLKYLSHKEVDIERMEDIYNRMTR